MNESSDNDFFFFFLHISNSSLVMEINLKLLHVKVSFE